MSPEGWVRVDSTCSPVSEKWYRSGYRGITIRQGEPQIMDREPDCSF